MMDPNILLNHLPPVLNSAEFLSRVTTVQRTTQDERNAPVSDRLLMLEKEHEIFYPRREFFPVYNAMVAHMRQGYALRCRELTHNGRPIVGHHSGRDLQSEMEKVLQSIELYSDERAILMTGPPGAGKSYGLNKIISLFPSHIDHGALSCGQHHLIQIPVLRVRCLGRYSARDVGNSFVRAVTNIVGPAFTSHLSRRTTVPELFAGIAGLCNLFAIGLVIWDEFQDILEAAHSDYRRVLNLILAVIAVSKTPMLFCGTYHTYDLFSRDIRAGRRFAQSDFRIHRFVDPKSKDWKQYCRTRWIFQYVRKQAELTDELIAVLYRYSQGLPDFVETVLKNSQIVAMDNNSEILNVENIKEGFARSPLIHGAVLALTSGDIGALKMYPDLWHPSLADDPEEQLKRAEQASAFAIENDRVVFR